MKPNIHPENYLLVAFKDMSNEDVFITKSTAPSKEKIKVDMYSLSNPSFKSLEQNISFLSM